MRKRLALGSRSAILAPMSTPCKTKLSPSYSREQVLSEIRWLSDKASEVREEMKRRPSKVRHLHDLERQIKDRKEILGRD